MKTNKTMAKQVTPAIESEWWWWPWKVIWEWHQYKESGAAPDEPNLLDPYGPYAALRTKLEHEPVYCAPRYHGQLYLGATLPRLIAPTSFIIEHWPKDTVVGIGSAPKEFELWVKVPYPDDDELDWYSGTKVQELIMERYGQDIIDHDSNPQRRKVPESLFIAFGYPWIPVGR